MHSSTTPNMTDKKCIETKRRDGTRLRFQVVSNMQTLKNFSENKNDIFALLIEIIETLSAVKYDLTKILVSFACS